MIFHETIAPTSGMIVSLESLKPWNVMLSFGARVTRQSVLRCHYLVSIFKIQTELNAT